MKERIRNIVDEVFSERFHSSYGINMIALAICAIAYAICYVIDEWVRNDRERRDS